MKMARLVKVTSVKALSRLDQIQRVANQVAAQGAPRAAADASKVATAVTRNTWNSQLSGRPQDRPSSPLRPSTNGRGDSFMLWSPAPGANGIEFNWAQATAGMPYLAIQEIGTGRKANIADPVNGRTMSYAIPSQRGRFISPRLLWSTRMGGQPEHNGAIGTGQLYPASMLDPSAVANFRSSRKRIRREIRGKHAVQQGGIAGFYRYEANLAAEWSKIAQALRP